MDTPNVVSKEPRISPTLAINQHALRLQEKGKEVFRFGFGQSPFPVPPSVVAALQENAHQKDYLPTAGLPALRTNIATHFSQRLNLPFSYENVMIGPGSKELLFLAQWVSDSTLLLPAPSWVTYAPQAALLQKKVAWLNTSFANNYCLQADTLEAYCEAHPSEKKMLILNSPNNPTGTAYGKENLKALAQVARKYNLIIVSDEIYGRLHHQDGHQSIATYYPEGTMITEGLSKWCGAGGWRLGLIIIPTELAAWQSKMIEIASETFSCVNAPIQYAAVEAYRESANIDGYLQHSRAILKTISGYIANQLNDAGISTPLPEGGFYLFPDFSNHRDLLTQKGIQTSEELCQALLEETGVALLPGNVFGREAQELTARLAYVDFDGKQALDWCEKKGIDQLGLAFLETCCPKIIKGTASMCSWIQR